MKPRLAVPLLLALLALTFLASLAFGELRLSFGQVLGALTNGTDEVARTVVRDFRLPRALVGLAVGAALGASGVVMQAFFRNPLASPGLLGVSSGGALGAVAVLATGPIFGFAAATMWALPLASVVGAFAATGMVLMLAQRGAGTERLLLSGVALNALLGAGTSFLLTTTAGHFEVNAQILFWLMGGLESRSWEHVWMGVPAILVACLLLLPLGRAMDLLSLGEQSAQSLGVDVRRLRRQLIVLSTVLTALATAVAGIVGFVGLVVPHVLRLAFGPDHRRLLPYSMLGGASFLLACDLVTRTFPLGLRLGVVTALIGGPFFLWLLRRPR
ncbi:MAG: iron ABC transporter permease [Geothrix sp.]|uniref:FecCD family ABC transporter permease n=1 Tax=Geothrix sp. TaxID=1962974 RepID=UPI001820F6A9|nr:iron ABC transporter permease [Geothrix sp.]NWJ40815.1 iron ABC transporter permease [Geothrix sp.]WIL21183.1 MAG: iron ABC transporter permease [Geothrix sp.]